MNIKTLFLATLTMAIAGCNSASLQSIASTASSAYTNYASSNSDSAATQGFATQYAVNPALAMQDPLLASYGTSVILMFQAQETWLSAVGNAEGAAALKAEREALENGAVIDGDLIERHAKLSTETNALLKESTANETKLSEQGRAEFAAGWIPYLTGLWQSYEASKKAGDYATYIASTGTNFSIANSANLFDAGTKSMVLGTLVANVPEFLSMQYDTFNLIVDYARDQNIEVPAEADSALSDITL